MDSPCVAFRQHRMGRGEIYAGYKSIQLWSRFAGDARKERAIAARTARRARALSFGDRLEGLLIKACQFIATRADVLPDEWV